MEKSRNPKNDKRLERAQSGTARAALLGVSDGLVTNVSLILGVAGAGAGSNVVRLAGIASLIAGACSMAVGEYISMRGQVELLTSVLDVEREELRNDPNGAHKELESIFVKDGVAQATAHTAATDIMKDPDKAMALYARGKLGVNPDELGSANASAVSSFIMFSLGAFVPLVPWFIATGVAATVVSVSLSMITALAIGGYLGYTTNGRMVRSALRQLIVLVAAAGVTFIIGHLFHANVS
jgi:VIT1/CCC1 family predicted Fe2+/Mn2+ transporter